MSYYDEILDQIQRAMSEENYEEAQFLLKKELSMPYIPEGFEQKLMVLKKEVEGYLRREKGEVSLDCLLTMLQKKADFQIQAVSQLLRRNLRDVVPELQDYLEKEPNVEAASLLIEGLAEQGIREEFHYRKDGVEYVFWPEEIIPVSSSDGFLEAKRYLKVWLENNHPDFLELCMHQLIHDCYVFLPLHYDAPEGRFLALSILEKISSYMDDGNLYQEIISKEEKKSRMS
ncbi:hypothetical protein HMPREF9013_0424 [Bulleidia extructa W1219]|uniref:DUF3196 domain-containing protein n=1 Tax=Bulleidia extructa W1219 TaxID=679192 RepID=D2MQ76_9FIRM|nr:DUF3196 family protein [Bulleidia extructa]EFC05145.1 hypothetical protein HMPREF9013_0424 [Bulleidia extructa W1219]